METQLLDFALFWACVVDLLALSSMDKDIEGQRPSQPLDSNPQPTCMVCQVA